MSDNIHIFVVHGMSCSDDNQLEVQKLPDNVQEMVLYGIEGEYLESNSQELSQYFKDTKNLTYDDIIEKLSKQNSVVLLKGLEKRFMHFKKSPNYALTILTEIST